MAGALVAGALVAGALVAGALVVGALVAGPVLMPSGTTASEGPVTTVNQRIRRLLNAPDTIQSLHFVFYLGNETVKKTSEVNGHV